MAAVRPARASPGLTACSTVKSSLNPGISELVNSEAHSSCACGYEMSAYLEPQSDCDGELDAPTASPSFPAASRVPGPGRYASVAGVQTQASRPRPSAPQPQLTSRHHAGDPASWPHQRAVCPARTCRARPAPPSHYPLCRASTASPVSWLDSRAPAPVGAEFLELRYNFVLEIMHPLQFPSRLNARLA